MAEPDVSPVSAPDPTQAGPQPGPAWAVTALFGLGLLLGSMAGMMPAEERAWRYFFVALGGAAGAWLASRRGRTWLLFPLACLVLIAVQESHRLALTWTGEATEALPPDRDGAALLIAALAVLVSCAVRHLENLRELFGGRVLDRQRVLRGEVRIAHGVERFVVTYVHPSLVMVNLAFILALCGCPALPLWLGVDGWVLWTDLGLATFLFVSVGWTLVWGLPTAVRERGMGVMLEEFCVVVAAAALLLNAAGNLSWAAAVSTPLFVLFLVQGISRLNGAGFLIHGALGLAAGAFPLFECWGARRGVGAWALFGGIVAVLAAGELWSFGIVEGIAQGLYLSGRFPRAFRTYLALASTARDPHARQRCFVLAASAARRAGLLFEAASTYESCEQWADAGELYLHLARSS